MTERLGQCLCGAVEVRGTRASNDVTACHCDQCQRWTGGGPLLSVKVVDAQMDEAAVGTYRASAHGERGFCKQCGTTLFWRMQGEPTRYVPVGLLTDRAGLKVTSEIFIDDRPAWFGAWNGAEQRTEAQELALLDAYLEGKTT